jgi:hypothetical protein
MNISCFPEHNLLSFYVICTLFSSLDNHAVNVTNYPTTWVKYDDEKICQTMNTLWELVFEKISIRYGQFSANSGCLLRCQSEQPGGFRLSDRRDTKGRCRINQWSID